MDGEIAAAEPSAATQPAFASRGLVWLLGLVTGIGPFAMQLYLPALPVIQADLGATASATQITVSGFVLAMAFAMPLIGPIADQFGRRPVLAVCLGIFFVGSLAGWLAPNIELLIASRIVQGAGGAGGLILARAIVSDLFDRRAMARVIAQLTMIMVLAPTVAPLLGGLVTDLVGWRVLFLLQAAAALIGLAAVLRWLPETLARRRTFHPVELVRGFGVVLRRPLFVGYTVQAAFSMCVFLAFISAAPYVIAAGGHPPSQYGLYFLLMAVGYAAGNFVTSKTTERVDPDRLIVIGLSISLGGTCLMLLLAMVGYAHPLALFVPALFLSLGQGIASPNTQTGAVKQAPDLAGTASGVASFVQNLFGAAIIQAIVLLPNQDGVGLSAVLSALSLLALMAIFWTLRRARALGVQT